MLEGDIRGLQPYHKPCENVDDILHEAALNAVPRSIKHFGIEINNDANRVGDIFRSLASVKEIRSFTKL